MDEKWEKVGALDLNPVLRKFASKKSRLWHLGHSSARLEREYRQFLYLIISNQGKTVVPWSRDLDDFWHEHILDTAKYSQDCDLILGQSIHHNPHLPKGSAAHNSAFVDTRAMYRAAFGGTVRKGRRRSAGDVGCDASMPVVFCASAGYTAPHGSTHHGGGHHGGHGGGGHGGHGCGGHGCGGHGCGGHGCGGGH